MRDIHQHAAKPLVSPGLSMGLGTTAALIHAILVCALVDVSEHNGIPWHGEEIHAASRYRRREGS
jgi:hypothetical protein